MEPLEVAASLSPPFQPNNRVVDDAFAQSMGFVTTYLRAVESARTDHIIYDPFAEPLTRKDRLQIQQFMNTVSGKYHRNPEDMIAIRTRYLDEALSHRNPEIHQIVLLGAGLDARAYRLEALRDCHVLEIDQGAAMFDHKSDVMTELHAPMLAKQVDCIVFNLADAGLEVNLLARGFDPTRPTFWAMEGLLPYMDRPSNVELLKAIDYLSWPGSELWADTAGRVLLNADEWVERSMKYGEDDPLRGVFSEIPWDLELQADMGTPGTHFGRDWTPLVAAKSEEVAPFFYIGGKKPIPDVVV
ncbi:hypothetical protein BBJ28_00025351, partial [Nothophytophthora sp. Chile5]